ncbi:MAG: hypothetical protein FJ387_13155 [Verrucomicrobia bacterium]|nr:hypothetical protein [Verrucomicrobiota bacterium]
MGTDLDEVGSDASATPHKDRSTGLLVFGVLEILLGFVAVLMVPLMVLGQVMAARMGQGEFNVRLVVPAAVFYGGAAVIFVWLGIGSIRARRWARALVLVVGWSWLAMGVVGSVLFLFIMPQLLSEGPPGGEPLPETARQVGLVVGLGFVLVLFVAVPAVLVGFFQSRHVKATCEARDPGPSWTDACPLPVLVLSFWLMVGAFSLLTLPLSSNSVLPCFGILLSGIPGGVVCGILATLWIVSAVAAYRLKPVGWWIPLVCVLVLGSSAVVTFGRVDLAELYRTMGYTAQQIELMQNYRFLHGSPMWWWSVGWTLLALTYLLAIKRYFRRPRSSEPTLVEPALPLTPVPSLPEHPPLAHPTPAVELPAVATGPSAPGEEPSPSPAPASRPGVD